MSILHIACGFYFSRVYEDLFRKFAEKDMEFNVYAPQHENINLENSNDDYPYNLYTNKIIKRYDKILYFTKIKRMQKDIEKNYDLDDIKIIHAHSLFSDGGVAYDIYLKHRIPYIVAIRNTDVNKYYKYALHLRKHALKILLNAEKIIFISPSYKELVLKKYIPEHFKKKINDKIEIIPNGINDFWLLTKKELKRKKKEKLYNFLFVGRIDKNKNLKLVIEGTKTLIEKGYNCNLHIIGDGPLAADFKRKLHNNNDFIFHGKINDKRLLKKIYSFSDVLIVPSFSETFGLVYAESLSCGTPIIYTKGQGFDGFFDEGYVGYSVNPNDKENLILNVMAIINDDDIFQRCYTAAKKFNWSLIANQYEKIYQSIQN